MKKNLTFWSVLLMLSLLACQAPSKIGKAILELDTHRLDFGSIQGQDTLRQYFRIKNAGNAPLLIQDINSSCGCTIPVWEKAALLPGQEQEIEVLVLPKEIQSFEDFENRTFNKKIVIRANTDSLFTVVEVLGSFTPDAFPVERKE